MKSAGLCWIFKHENMHQASGSEERGNVVSEHMSDSCVVLPTCLLSHDYLD